MCGHGKDATRRRISNAQGDFEISGIVPGLFMYLGLNYKFDDDKVTRAVGALAPGETKDLGNLVIRSP